MWANQTCSSSVRDHTSPEDKMKSHDRKKGKNDINMLQLMFATSPICVQVQQDNE